jgi:hypothetical protein
MVDDSKADSTKRPEPPPKEDDPGITVKSGKPLRIKRD